MKQLIALLLALTLVFSMASCASTPAEDTAQDEAMTDTENTTAPETDAEDPTVPETDTEDPTVPEADTEDPTVPEADTQDPTTGDVTEDPTADSTNDSADTNDTTAALSPEEQEVLDTLQQLVAGAADEIMCDNIILPADQYPYYLFIDYIDGSIAASASALIGSIPHSVVLLKLPEDADVAAVAADIEANMDPRKWICVEAEATMVKTSGQYVLMVMSSQATVDAISANFDTVFGA